MTCTPENGVSVKRPDSPPSRIAITSGGGGMRSNHDDRVGAAAQIDTPASVGTSDNQFRNDHSLEVADNFEQQGSPDEDQNQRGDHLHGHGEGGEGYAINGHPNDESEDSRARRKWRESPFAVGLTQPTWADEDTSCSAVFRCCRWCVCLRYSGTTENLNRRPSTSSLSSRSSHRRRDPLEITKVHPCFAFICKVLRLGRVGNMVVVWQRIEEYALESPVALPNGEEQQHSYGMRPRLLCVLGPYWPALLGITLPLLMLITVAVGITKVRDDCFGVQVSWIVCNIAMFGSLLLVACSDPGIMYRHAQIPESTLRTADRLGPGEDQEWRWNDQALTYRPPHAQFDPECAAVIEYFDHTCPWTGTAIGKNNMNYFRLFLISFVVALIYNAALLCSL